MSLWEILSGLGNRPTAAAPDRSAALAGLVPDPDGASGYADMAGNSREARAAAGLATAPMGALDYFGKTLRGAEPLYDPSTGHPSDEAYGAAATLAGLAATGNVPRLLAASPASEVEFGAFGGRGAVAAADRAAQPVRAPFPQYAERYPEVGPPVEAIDPKKGNAYLAKQLTPEAEAFQKSRAKIMKDMEKNGYEPHFDVSERYYADPGAYPPNTNTLEIVPKKQATIDKDMATIGNEEARARLAAAYERGAQLPDTADWYAMGQLEKAFIDELGPEAGRQAFRDRFATSMAATTGGADPTSNLLMAQYGNYLRANNLPYPTASHELPFPIGGRYGMNNIEKHKEVFDNGGFAALGADNPKRHNFAQNFMGNRDVATMDEQMTSGMTPGLQMPPPGKYGLYEGVLHDEAAKAGVPPANFQDVAWAGFKNMKDPRYAAGEPMIQTVNEAIERTHRLTGMPREEIVRRGLVRGEVPLYSTGVPPVPMPQDSSDR
jgi:hypothetical protein